MRKRLLEQTGHCLAVALTPFAADHTALVVNLLGIEGQVAAPVAQDKQT